jgi:hypothetical protein
MLFLAFSAMCHAQVYIQVTGGYFRQLLTMYWHCRISHLVFEYVCLFYCPGVKLSRRVLSCCWDSMLSVLSAGLGDLRGQLGVTSSLALLLGSEVAREEHRRARESIVASLEGLQKAARLSNILGTDSAQRKPCIHCSNFYH